jgi:16S rRNA (guanine527-N7)-methyltransferase
MTRDDLSAVLERGAKALDVELSEAQISTLIDYIALLERWNRRYNLTAVRDPRQMVARHLLDSLSIVPFVKGRSLLDIGSGAGLPGLVLAVAIPGLSATLLDSALKRTRFLSHAVRELGLRNTVTVVRERLDMFEPEILFDTITCRATLALNDLVEPAMALADDGGRLVAMLGKAPQQADESWSDRFSVRIERVRVPGLDAQRHAAVVERLANVSGS